MLEARETNNWEAFELATDALRDIDAFVSSRRTERSLLLDAKQKLATAKTEDPNFLRAEFYGAVVDDLLGNSQEAVQTLNALLDRRPAFQAEAEYNLAVSYYHLYTLPNMEKAVALFERILAGTSDPVTRLLSQAGLARSSAMMVLFSARTGNQIEADRYFTRATFDSGAVLNELQRLKRKIKKGAATEIEWRVLNGRGVAFMFHSDTVSDRRARQAELDKALADFSLANSQSPDNWEIVCNLGSVHMRFGYLHKTNQEPERGEQSFRLAEKYLENVLDQLYPEYGFAIYELGRLRRLEGKMPEALALFYRSQSIPKEQRAVSDRTLDGEIARAQAGDVSFP